MVHGNVGQSDLTREDMTRYIRYLVDVIGNEQRALYSYLEDRTNPYICLHGECQTLADWISVLLEAYNQPFQRWDMELDLLVFGRLVNEMKPNEVPKQIRVTMTKGEKMSDDLRGRKYCHTVIEWDGLYWDANGGGTQLEKEEYYEGMTYWTDGEVDRKRLLHIFFDWEEMKGYLEGPLVEESIDYTWHWKDKDLYREDLLPDELWIEEMGTGVSPYDNLGVFRDFINHLRTDDFAAERIYFDDEYGGFIKGNPRANELPGEVAFPGEEERLAKIMTPEEYAELEQEVNLIVSKNLPYNVESLSEDERIALHEDIILKIVNHEYIHQSIDDEVLEWAIENNKTKGEYYAAHEIMAYVDMALRESIGMRGFKLHLTNLVAQHPILTDNPELGERVMDALTRTRKGQRFQVPAEIETLMRAFQSEDYEILVVGGAVRDMLMRLKPKDYDLATNATPEEVESVVSTLEGYRTITTPEAQMARGVLTTLVLPPSGEVIEVTTFRAELGYEAGTRRPVAVAADTFYEDSLRRDFTMNALGWRLNGTILDYHEGVDDIEFGQLVSVGDASERLEEDPLRILRAVRFASRYGLEIDDELGEAIGMNLSQLLTLSSERIRRELDSILKLEEGVYDLVNIGIIETIIPQYQGGYWGDRGYGGGDPKFSFIADIQSYSMVDQSYPSQFNYTPRPWQPSIAYALLFKNVVTKEEFNEQYRRGPISFSKAEADMIAELIALYPVALESEEPRDVVAIVTSPYYAELMMMLEYTNRLDLVDYFTPYRQRYKGKPPKGYAMTVADRYGIEPGPALGERLSEITEAIILGDIEDWDEGLNYYAAESDKSSEDIPEFVYHATPGKNLESIMEHGLEPRIGELSIHAFGKERYDEKVGGPKVWATTNNKARIYAALIAPMSYLEDNAILRIKTEGLDFKYYGFEEFFTDKHVPPSHIEHMYFIMGEKSEEDPNWTVDQQIDYVHAKYGACPYFIGGERHCFDGRICTYTESSAEEVGTRERISYAGVILDEATSEQLLARFESDIPEDWTRYAHHMTVSLGKSIPNQADLGTEVTLTVTAVGKSDDAIAVAVSGYPSRNAIPHITLAVPPGGKPFNSNKITDWHSVEPFEIQGQLQDVKTYVAEEAETFRSESSRDWSLQYTWQPVPVEDLIDFRRNRYSLNTLQLDDILNLKTLYRGTRKLSSIREGMFDFFGSGEINESEQIPETVYFYTWERPYPTERWERHNADWECACGECAKYAFNHQNASSKATGLIRSTEFKPAWEETPEGSEVVRVLFIPHLFDEIVIGNPLPNSRNPRSHVTRNNLTLEDYGFEPVIWSERRNKNSKGGFYASPYNTNLRALEQRLGRGVGRTLNYPRFSSESVMKYAESFWGNAGSGVLVVARDTQRILLGLRSEDVNEPNTWGNFGGAIGVTDFGEPEEALPPEDNALKEMAEEIGYTGAIEMMPSFTYRSPEFTYYNFIGIVEQESDIPLNQFNWEVSELQWFTLAEIMALPNLHFGVSALMSQEEMITFNAEDIPLNNSPSYNMTHSRIPKSVKYDDFGNPFVTFYHATTMDNYESIETFGLRMSQPGYYEKAEFETYDNVAGVYFTSDLKAAQLWIGWKYRESICYRMDSLEEAGYEVSLIPNEIAGVIYAVDFPLELVYDDLIEYKWSVQNVKPDPEVSGAWYSTDEIPRSKMSIVGFYSLPICLNQGWNDGGDGVQQITESTALQIHNHGFYIDAQDKEGNNVWDSAFTRAKRLANRYIPIQHLKMPRDPIFSGYRGTFMSESIPMSDWSKLNPVELVELSQFPTGDDHMDGWDMYLPRDWPHWDVLERADAEHWQIEQKYLKDNDLKYLPWAERHKLPYTIEEIYAKYFDFWYIPAVANSMSGGGRGQIYNSIKEAYAPDTWELESKKRGLPFNEHISLEEAAKYFSPQTIDRYREGGRETIPVWNQPVVNAFIDEHLALGREDVLYAPVIVAAHVDVEVGTDATKIRGGATLLDGWHRDAYAGLFYDQDPSQGLEGPPTVFFKPKEKYL